MADLTDHQRSIMQAVLLGLEIQISDGEDDWQDVRDIDHPISFIDGHCDRLRIKPGEESKVGRLYEITTQRTTTYRCFTAYKDQFSAEYIDINPETGVIVGGKL